MRSREKHLPARVLRIAQQLEAVAGRALVDTSGPELVELARALRFARSVVDNAERRASERLATLGADAVTLQLGARPIAPAIEVVRGPR